jgi:hypothetical protein
MATSERAYALAGLCLAALGCVGTWLGLPQIQKILWPPQPVEAAAQEATSWSYDGLVHVGNPKPPTRVWESFQRFSNGAYRRK